LLVFVSLGFGLLSKQMVFVLMGLFLLWAVMGARHLLKNPLFYLSVFGANVWLVPSWLWNANNGNATTEHTAHHFESSEISFGAVLSRVGEFVGQELLLIGVISFPLILFLCVRYFYDFSRLEKGEKMVLTFCVPVLLIMMAMMFRQRINANWPVAFLLMGVVATAIIFVRVNIVWFRWAVGANIFLTLIASVLIPSDLVKIQQRDWKAWPEMATSLNVQLDGANYDAETDFLLTCYERYYASQLSYYMEGQPQFYYWPGSFDENGVADKIEHQYSFWAGPKVSEKSRAFIFVPKGKGVPSSLKMAFSSIDKIGAETITWKSIFSENPPKEVRSVELYLATGYQGWPKSKFIP